MIGVGEVVIGVGGIRAVAGGIGVDVGGIGVVVVVGGVGGIGVVVVNVGGVAVIDLGDTIIDRSLGCITKQAFVSSLSADTSMFLFRGL